jgi:plastocyanin
VVVTATPPGGLAVLTFNETVTPLPVVVNVANISFTSVHNGTVNPAVDTVSVGQPVQWNWIAGNHGIQSTGNPSFTSGPTQSSGSYSVIFNTAGTYQYDCTVHLTQMTGRIVAQ